MRTKSTKIILFTIFILVGILLSYLIVHSSKEYESSSIITPKVLNDYKNELDNLDIKKKELNDNITDLENKLDSYKNEEGIDYLALENELYNELIRYDIIAGKKDVQGPGVKISMSDSNEILQPGDNISDYIIHNNDILEIINELRFSGAEVIAINGYQLSWNSNIDCAGPVIYIDDFIAGAPFIIEAIGNRDKIIATLNSDESYVELLKFRTINISIVEKENIILNKN
ncbi:DUF881 domain-containing protein [Alkalibaculum sp. M08DMB]|uniref:DUF881 domain-containing protein n=1 Tax=Alkalibaculum sporogenes TaxID=2655001 RepID=A0A6A7K723_9FIRM|nr:DUF881 domain-containing protein [Alkalibaculum sporogenes]MPW25185.1 DUF881 domain-containing protein [Alkalibaculum sporogenes]